MLENNKANNSLNLDTVQLKTNRRTILESILISVKSGLNGALIVFTLLFASKLFSSIVVASKNFSITFNDFILTFWGFLLFSFITLAGILKDSKESKD